MLSGTGSAALPWSERPYVIAEAGVNHNGDLTLAKRLIDAARAAGADAVKFQTWKPGEITGKFAVKVSYLETSTPEDESRYELSRRLCLPYEAFVDLKAHCEAVGIQFLSTPDGFESLDFLVDELKMPIIKVGSTELTHVQFLEAVGRKRLPTIMSTGIGTLGEVEAAVAALRRGGGDDLPIVVLQCTSQYPAPPEEMNLRAMVTMGRALGVPVGLSDHSMGWEASVAAIALGARVIEKHFTLDRGMAGPDHAASLEPEELTAMVAGLHRTSVMLGSGIKSPTPSEKANMGGIRRSVVAVGDLPAGTVLERRHLTCKRPASGVPPRDLDALLGMTLNRPLLDDEPVQWKDVW